MAFKLFSHPHVSIPLYRKNMDKISAKKTNKQKKVTWHTSFLFVVRHYDSSYLWVWEAFLCQSEQHLVMNPPPGKELLDWICQVTEYMFSVGLKHHVTQHHTESQIPKSAPLPICPQPNKAPPALTLSSLSPVTDCKQWPAARGGARRGRCGAASDQSELELCVTCKGEAPECDNSWVFKWSFSAWRERNRWQRAAVKRVNSFCWLFKTETCYLLVFFI